MTGTQAQTNPTTQAARRGRIEPGAVAASALAFGALSLPDPDRLTPARRRLLTLGRAAFLGWYTWDLTRRNPVPEVPATALWAVTGASLSLAFAPLDEATDRWLSGHLRRRGVQRPRLALALIGLVFVHIVALHEVGSNNPDGIEIKEHKGPDGTPLDGVAFHPYHTSKDLVAIIVFLMIFSSVVFFAPDMGGYFLEHANFEPANTKATPEHIAPVWYFTPYYAILRAVPDKLWGAILMAAAVLLPLFLPWLDRSRVRSIRYRGWLTRILYAIFVVAFVALGWLGLQSGSEMQTLMARIFTFYYFAFFITMPFWSRIDRVRPVPERVTLHD